MKFSTQKIEKKQTEYWIHADYRPEQAEGFTQESVVFYSKSAKAEEFLKRLCAAASTDLECDEKRILRKALDLACAEGGWDVSYWTDCAAMS